MGGSSRHALTQLFPSFLLSFVHFPRTNETCCRQLQRLRAARDPIGRKALSVEKNGCRQEWAPRTDGREPGQAAHRGGAGWGPGSSFHVSAVHPSPQRSPPLPPPAATPRTLRTPLALCRPSAPPGPVRAGAGRSRLAQGLPGLPLTHRRPDAPVLRARSSVGGHVGRCHSGLL